MNQIQRSGLKRMMLLSIIILLIAGCQSQRKLSDQIIEHLDSHCTTGDECKVSLQSITDFEWDKMAFFVIGSSKSEISKALGIDYEGETDLSSGMVFVFNNKVVNEMQIQYDPEHPSKLQIFINGQPEAPNCLIFAPNNAIFQGLKKRIDGVMYYSLTVSKE